MTFDQILTVVVSIIGIATSFGYYLQAYRIWRNKSSADISLTTYVILIVGTNTYLAYGFYRHDIVIIAGFVAGAIGSWLVFLLALYYRRA